MTNIELFPKDDDEGVLRKFTSRELRAIGNAIKRYRYVPHLSLYPTVEFTSLDTGAKVALHIDELLNTYDQDRKEDVRERARIRKKEAHKHD